jgi:hypothetical protein
MGRVITLQYAMLRSLERRLDEIIAEIDALLSDYPNLARTTRVDPDATASAGNAPKAAGRA